jgi:hypothetical protein
MTAYAQLIMTRRCRAFRSGTVHACHFLRNRSRMLLLSSLTTALSGRASSSVCRARSPVSSAQPHWPSIMSVRPQYLAYLQRTASIQARVADVDHDRIVPMMSAAGFRCRPESWNRTEDSAGVECAKLVFAPPVGARSCNVHIRLHDGPNTRHALLFRDFLRADDRARRSWVRSSSGSRKAFRRHAGFARSSGSPATLPNLRGCRSGARWAEQIQPCTLVIPGQVSGEEPTP